MTKLVRTGAPVTAHNLLAGVLNHHRNGGDYLKARATEHPLKKYLRNSRRRNAPITLPTSPFDHRGEQS